MIFVHLTTTSWKIGQVMSRQAMTRALSKYGMNLYFTPAVTFALKGNDGLEEKADRNIILLKPSSEKGFIYRNERLKKIQINRQIHWLQKKIDQYRAPNEPIVLYVWHYMFYPFVHQISHDVLVFHIYDDVFMYYNSSPRKNDVIAERHLIEEADIVLVVGEDLARHKNVNRPWIPCPGGVNMSIFKRMEPDLEAFGLDSGDHRKKAGYFGRFNSKIDFPLLWEIVRKGSNYLFLFAGLTGNMNAADQKLWQAILDSENVRYFGPKSQQELVHLYNALDVGLMPYHYKKGWSQFAIPLKFTEFLALGKPVVSTPLIPLKKFTDLVSLEDTAEGFLHAFERLIETDSPEIQARRIAFARSNSWENRAKTVYEEIAKKLKK